MSQARVRAVFMRGGTSRALFFRPEDLPAEPDARDRLILAALGSPDPGGRQLDGLGGGYSSVSKVAIVGPSRRPDVQVEYTFGQVDVTTPRIDWRGNCGNISSAVGPFAIDEGLAAGPLIRFVNTNTDKVIVAHVPLDAAGDAAVEGDFELPGVAGRGARITLEFLDPGGAATGRLLPTDRPRDRLEGLEVSLVDATNPMVFVRAGDVGLTCLEQPAALDADLALHWRLETLRVAGAAAMGLPPGPAVPKIALVAPSEGDYADLRVLVVSMGKFHRAVALTAAMCLAVATRLPGTVVHELTRPGDLVRIAHPAGVLPLAATSEKVVVYRTARRLMEGFVRVPASALSGADPRFRLSEADKLAPLLAAD